MNAIPNGATPIPDELYILTNQTTGKSQPLRKATDAELIEFQTGVASQIAGANQAVMQALGQFAQLAQLKAVVDYEIERRKKQLVLVAVN